MRTWNRLRQRATNRPDDRLERLLAEPWPVPDGDPERVMAKVMERIARTPYRPAVRRGLLPGLRERHAWIWVPLPAAAACAAVLWMTVRESPPHSTGARAVAVARMPGAPSPQFRKSIPARSAPEVAASRAPVPGPGAVPGASLLLASAGGQAPAPPSPPLHRNAAGSAPASHHSPTASRPARRVPAGGTGERPTSNRSAPSRPADSTARLAGVEGSVMASVGNAAWRSLPPDSPVQVDQRVRCGVDSRVGLSLGRLEIRMNGETEVTPVREPDARSPVWVVRLVHGELFARAPEGEPGIRVITASGDVEVTGGECVVTSADPFATRVTGVQGAARIESGGESVTVESGMQTTVRLGTAPEAPQAADDLASLVRWALVPLARDRWVFRP